MAHSTVDSRDENLNFDCGVADIYFVVGQFQI